MAVSRLSGLILWQIKGNENSRSISLSGKDINTFIDKSQVFSSIKAGERDDVAVQSVALQYIDLLDASHNRIHSLVGMTNFIPSVWWANFRYNFLSQSSSLHLPGALGSLDLCHNPISSDVLHVLAHKHILRLYMDVGNTLLKDRETLSMCPNTWVFNDNYFVYNERSEMESLVENTPLWIDIRDKALKNSLITLDINEQSINVTAPQNLEQMKLNVSLTGSLDLSTLNPERGNGNFLQEVVGGQIGGISLALSDDISVRSEVGQDGHDFDQWQWRNTQSLRQGSFLAALNKFTPSAAYPIDFYRLDVLLEDYLDEAHLANASSIPYKAVQGQRYPVVDVLQVLSLPRRSKMDLSLLLSVNILVELPSALLSDVAIHMLLGYMSPNAVKDLLRLPSFAKTAVLALIRRVLDKEEEELKKYGILIDKYILSAKPVVPSGPEGFVPTFSASAEGWYHLHGALRYLHCPIDELEKFVHQINGGKPPAVRQKSGPVSSLGSVQSALGASDDLSAFSSATSDEPAGKSTLPNKPYRFSQLEFQLLRVLPNVITPTTPLFAAEYAKKTQWVNLAARHVVVLLTRSPLCPSLTDAQTSAKAQVIYDELFPLLKLAKMTHSDLVEAHELETRSGRVQTGRDAAADGEPDDVFTLIQELKANKSRMRGNGGQQNEFAFGVGLPRGTASKLTWNQEGKTFAHAYDTWNDHKHPERKELREMEFFHMKMIQQETERKRRGHAASSVSTVSQVNHTFDFAGIATPKKDAKSDLDELSLDSLSLDSLGARQDGKIKSPPASHFASSVSTQRGNGSISLPVPGYECVVDGDLDAVDKAVLTDALTDEMSPFHGVRLDHDDPKSLQNEGSLEAGMHDSRSPVATQYTFVEGSLESSAFQPNFNAAPLSPDHTLPRNAALSSPQNMRSPLNRAVATISSPNRSATVINGFSMNSARESSFILAPTSLILEKNKSAVRPMDKLSMLHQAPVLVHPKSPAVLAMPESVPGRSQMLSVKSVPEFPGKFIYGPTHSMSNDEASAASASSESSYTPAGAARNLLAEMGTLRNIRNLQIDVGSYRVPKADITARLQAVSSEGDDFSSRNEAYQSNKNWVANDDILAGASYPRQNLEQFDVSADQQTARTKKSLKVFKARDPSTFLTSADLVKIKTRYNNVFVTQQINRASGSTNHLSHSNGQEANGGQVGQQLGMRGEDTTVDGRPLSAPWYPVPKKPTFTLAPEVKDTLDRAIKDVYGVAESSEPNAVSSKLEKKDHLVTYTTAKLQVKQPPGQPSPPMITHPEARRILQEQMLGRTARFQTNIYENNRATVASRQFAALATSKASVETRMPTAELVNVGIRMQPVVKANFSFTSTNNNNDDSSLIGKTESYKYVPKLGLSSSFKVRANSRPKDVGIHFSVASSKF